MSRYYCHKCSIEQGIIPGNVEEFNPTGSTYQLEKFIKHTIPPTVSGNISVFDITEHKKYKDYIVNTLASGSVEIDDHGRTNIVWFAGQTTGWEYKDGEFQCEDDAVKVVLHDDEIRIHGFPTGSARISPKTCMNCGDEIVN